MPIMPIIGLRYGYFSGKSDIPWSGGFRANRLLSHRLGIIKESNEMKRGRVNLILKNRKGFTLIEIMAVMVIISVLAGVGMRKFDQVSESASAKALEQGLSELNSRELLTWALVKFSDQGWITDEALFAQLDKNMGTGYQWASGPAVTGGTLHMTAASITLTRTPSTVSSAGKWAAN